MRRLLKIILLANNRFAEVSFKIFDSDLRKVPENINISDLFQMNSYIDL